MNFKIDWRENQMELIKQFDDVTNSEGVYSQICNACVNALAVEKTNWILMQQSAFVV